MNNGPVERLRAWVAHEGSQVEAARKAGCSGSYLSLVLSGKRPRVGLDVACGIQEATRDWPEGPILVSEWLTVTDDHAPNVPQAAQVSSDGAVDGEAIR